MVSASDVWNFKLRMAENERQAQMQPINVQGEIQRQNVQKQQQQMEQRRQQSIMQERARQSGFIDTERSQAAEGAGAFAQYFKGLTQEPLSLPQPAGPPMQGPMRSGQTLDVGGPDVRPTPITPKAPGLAPLRLETVIQSIQKQNPNISPEGLLSALEKFQPHFEAQDRRDLVAARGALSSGGITDFVYQDALTRGLSVTEAAMEAAKYKRAGSVEVYETARARESGKTMVHHVEVARGAKDVLNSYTKLLVDAKLAPSGALETGIAYVSNLLNMPTEGAIAKGTFDADINNLFLATIRTLKGTGRVMKIELDTIKLAAPLSVDSMEVKMAKIKSHMIYYRQYMRDLGFDPDSGDYVGGGVSGSSYGRVIPTQQNAAPQGQRTINFNDLPE